MLLFDSADIYNLPIKEGAWATDETKPLIIIKSVCKTVPKSLFWAPPAPVYQDLSMHHDWSIKKAILDLPIRLKGIWNAHSLIINSLSLLGAQNKDLGAASQTLLTGVRLSLWCRPIKRRTSGVCAILVLENCMQQY